MRLVPGYVNGIERIPRRRQYFHENMAVRVSIVSRLSALHASSFMAKGLEVFRQIIVLRRKALEMRCFMLLSTCMTIVWSLDLTAMTIGVGIPLIWPFMKEPH